ncbi:MAG: hypothetical protein A4S09_11455 [Proteobacteria bacterium SG_bin7]|nr:MAG: hypothetical protein A4S09_11455 [Proteobacteria bacterium SG_bin7]
MELNIYDYVDYKSYISDTLKLRGHGAKKDFAKTAEIQESFLSQVLHAKADLSLEQADKANKFFGHTNDEAHFFLILAQRSRAGTVSLKNYFDKLIQEILEKKKNLKEQVKAKSNVSDEHRERFYSSWQFAAVQVATSIKEYQTLKSISQKLGISERRVAEILEFLLAAGLVIRKNDHFDMGTQSTHLGKDSPLVFKHHANWRLQTLIKLEEQNADNFHYSTIMSLSAEAAQQIKNLLVKTVRGSNEAMEFSREELLYVLGIDFYEL